MKSNEIFFSYQSYWDWLPPEMQEFIMLFVAGQFFVDLKKQVKKERQEQSIQQKLREELYSYHDLKAAWGLGHIQVQVSKKRCNCYHCERPMKITGYYRDYYELTKQSVYLGHSYAHARARMNHVKSFL